MNLSDFPLYQPTPRELDRLTSGTRPEEWASISGPSTDVGKFALLDPSELYDRLCGFSEGVRAELDSILAEALEIPVRRDGPLNAFFRKGADGKPKEIRIPL